MASPHRRNRSSTAGFCHVCSAGNALMKAACSRRLRLCRLLIEGGSSINSTNEVGQTPLTVVCLSDEEHQHAAPKEKVIEYFLQKGANVNSQDNRGRTCLIYSCMQNLSFAIIRLLIESGADPLIIDDTGTNALNYAAQHGNTFIIAALTESVRATGRDVILIKPTPSDIQEKLSERRQSYTQRRHNFQNTCTTYLGIPTMSPIASPGCEALTPTDIIPSLDEKLQDKFVFQFGNGDKANTGQPIAAITVSAAQNQKEEKTPKSTDIIYTPVTRPKSPKSATNEYSDTEKTIVRRFSRTLGSIDTDDLSQPKLLTKGSSIESDSDFIIHPGSIRSPDRTRKKKKGKKSKKKSEVVAIDVHAFDLHSPEDKALYSKAETSPRRCNTRTACSEEVELPLRRRCSLPLISLRAAGIAALKLEESMCHHSADNSEVDLSKELENSIENIDLRKVRKTSGKQLVDKISKSRKTTLPPLNHNRIMPGISKEGSIDEDITENEKNCILKKALLEKHPSRKFFQNKSVSFQAGDGVAPAFIDQRTAMPSKGLPGMGGELKGGHTFRRRHSVFAHYKTNS
ncbi:unnamed protein product [Owenia fusiformis]|uniref:Uncharacterized protein n=1 Tax=Owenia fusiformis TaxID=6347 RepID=A0A8J1TSA7_OWEFU|nr:unnamed protein product [Owenia fusiformis]